MRFALISSLCMMAMLALACNKKSASLAPDSLAGKILSGKITSGHGAFEGQAGYTFTTEFKDDSHYSTTAASGAVESTGSMRYRKSGPDTGVLTLTPSSSPRLGQELEITLKFVSTKDGTFEGHLKQGGSGDESGLFYLK
jgi:hypothetical protein